MNRDTTAANSEHSYGSDERTTESTGSPYRSAGNSRSCFKCGVFRGMSQLKGVRILGRTEMVCKPSCAEAAAHSRN